MKKMALFAVLLATSCLYAATYHVSVGGLPAGEADGSPSKPFSSLEDAVKASRASKGGPNEILVHNGIYRLEKTLRLGAQDRRLCIRALEPGKAILSGSKAVTGWRPVEGRPWLVADVPEAREGLFVRALVVDGKFAPRAEYPGKGSQLENTNEWTVRWLSSVGNGWERPPTHEEYTTMTVKPGDLPDTMDFASADVRVFHEWDNSLVRGASYDPTTLTVKFAEECRFPPGSFKRHGYVVYNVKEGMTEPGQWYLDGKTGQLFYWPRPGEQAAMPTVEIPVLETIMTIGYGGKDTLVGLRLSGLVFENAKVPLKRPSFSGRGINAALMGCRMFDTTFENLTFRNNGGLGIVLSQNAKLTLRESRFVDTGSCAVQLAGSDFDISRNKFLDSGAVFTSAAGVCLSGNDIRFCNNEIDGAPYCGVSYGGRGNLFASNRVSRVMQLLHDGAAFYGMSVGCTFRGNHVIDNKPADRGRHAFYYDEGSKDGLVVDNVIEGGFRVAMHNHMSRNIVISNNVIRTPGSAAISFSRSRNCVFVGNEIHAASLDPLPDVTTLARWEGNRIFVGGVFTNAVPTMKILPRQKSPVVARRTSAAPAFDGSFDANRWPGLWETCRRGKQGNDEGGAPHLLRVCHDGENAYFAIRIPKFAYEDCRAGKRADAVILSFPNLTVKGAANGVSKNADAFYGGMAQGSSATGFGKSALLAFKVPLAKLGTPDELKALPFNCAIYDAQYDEMRYWESPRYGDLPATLTFKDL